ncbi:MAG TPA: formate/nitrite transporter family protein [Opitutaceae bacterium]|nr:formate/nitrite transporter family protein [Opitutaceae bacterium]
MDYIKPTEVVKTMLAAGTTKAGLPVKDLLIRGFLSGALLGFATSLAITAAAQTNLPIVGAVIFPVGFVMIVLLGLELVTGSFALVPLAGVDGRSGWPQICSNLAWVFTGNLIGSVVYGWLLYLALTNCGMDAPSGIGLKIAAIAEAKTNAYAAHGTAGWLAAFVKAILCNWMVCLGVVMAMTTSSTIGKIAAAWLPILTFFAQGFEHSVVNMFVIPTGMMFGAKVSLSSWWIWNQIPVTLGNLLGGLLFTGLFLYWTYQPATQPAPVPAEELESGSEPARA